MYLKLALRNAKRSMADYLLYIFSMVVLSSIIYSSNFLANLGGIRAGFQTVSLPLIVVIVMAVLADWINTFIVKQRAKEFATYMLLGMEKDKLSLMFLCELCIVGMDCFLGGTALGMGFCFACFYFLPGDGGIGSIAEIMAKSGLQSFGYFCLIEALSFFLMKQKIYKLQVIQLMREKRRSRLMREGRRHFWGVMFAACFLIFLLLLFGSSFMGEGIMSAAVSIIAIPMILCVFSFYQWVYALLASVRLSAVPDWGNDHGIWNRRGIVCCFWDLPDFFRSIFCVWHAPYWVGDSCFQAGGWVEMDGGFTDRNLYYFYGCLLFDSFFIPDD